MINQEVYQRNPATLKLANQGVANVNDDKTSQAMSVLRYELDTFVCDGQYEKGFRAIFFIIILNVLSRRSNLGFGLADFMVLVNLI